MAARPVLAAISDATPVKSIELQGDQAFSVALQLFIHSGDYQKALDLLMSRPDLLDRPEGVRLRAELLLRLGHANSALNVIETYLSAHPDDALARFQLAEIYYNQNRDQSAGFAYRLAAAGTLDPMRQRMVTTRLESLNSRKSLKSWIGGSVSPDSNLNSGTSAHEIDIFGLPFELDNNARRRSGVRVSAYGGVEKRLVLSPSVLLRASLAGGINDLPGNDLDNAYLALKAGPEWLIGPAASLAVQATVSESWFGGARIERRRGIQVQSDSYARNTRWFKVLAIAQIDQSLNPDRDGDSYSLSMTRTHFLGSSTLWQAQMDIQRLQTRAPSEAYGEIQLSVGRLFQAPRASLLYIELGQGLRHYDAASAAFGAARRDVENHIELRLSKRDWLLAGAHPYFGVVASRNASTVALYSFEGVRAEFGLTREF